MDVPHCSSGESGPRRSPEETTAEDGPIDRVGSPPDPLSTALRTTDRVLVTGPPMTGKYDLLHRFLANRGTSGFLVSIDRSAERSRADYANVTETERLLHVLDCVDRDSEDPPARTRYASLNNLTDVGVAFTSLSDALHDDGDTPAVGLHSLSHLLAYCDTRHVSQFLHTMSAQITERGWPFLATMSSTAHDEQARHALYEPFDRLLETRVVESNRQFRVRDPLEKPTDWMPF